MSMAIDYSDGRFQLGKNVLIIAPKNRGKSNLVMTNIFLKLQSEINYLFVVSSDKKYLEITSHLFEETQLPTIFQEIQILNRMEKKLIIIDEMPIHQHPIIECILINSNYFNITVVLVSKYGNLNMVLRDYVDMVVLGNDNCATICRDLFDRYGMIYGDFTNFLEVITGMGRNEFLLLPKGRMNVGLIRVNDHWRKYLYSYKMFVRYDILKKFGDKKKDQMDLIKKVNTMMEELLEIKKKLAIV